MPDYEQRKMYGRFRVSEEFLDPNPKENLLSVGCKEAEFESYLVGKVGNITAVDIERRVIEFSKKKFPGISFEYGDIAKGLDYESESFDKILFLEVIEHLPRGTEDKALKELYRLLKKGGLLVLSTPNDNFLTTWTDPAYWLIRHRHYKLENILGYIKKAGFTIDKVFVGGGVIELIWLPFFYLFLRIRIARLIKPLIDKIIDREYQRSGFQTIIIRCRK